MSDAEKLRRNFAQYLAPRYRVDPAGIAALCDEYLDPTGALLGYVREAAGEVSQCHADRDGDCTWAGCPQLRDGEPEKTGRSCPLWNSHHDEDL